MSWNLLERFLQSDYFNNDPLLAVTYLFRYSQHVGIQYVLCSKLRNFSHDQIIFYLPQLCHILISIDTESMALEEFLTKYCEDSVTAALLTFWLLQSYLHDFSHNSLSSSSFKACQRIYNKIQCIIFGGSGDIHRPKIKENILPVTVLSSIILASIGAPFLAHSFGPLTIAQASRPRPIEYEQNTTEEIVGDEKRSKQASGRNSNAARLTVATATAATSIPQRERKSSGKQPPAKLDTHVDSSAKADSKCPKSAFPQVSQFTSGPMRKLSSSTRMRSSSLSELQTANTNSVSLPLPSAGLNFPSIHGHDRRFSSATRSLAESLNRKQQIRLLRSNYFHCETQFLTALQEISIRLVGVPKKARMSALRAELALVDQYLPDVEVDIPVIYPAKFSLNGEESHSSHHRVVRIPPMEATILNSAERVPYLLLLEVLKNDFDFDPDTKVNRRLLRRLYAEKEASKRRLFDLSETISRVGSDLSMRDGSDSGDDVGLGNVKRINDGTQNEKYALSVEEGPISGRVVARGSGPVDQDVGALAQHMRTAAQMLAKLEINEAKRPRAEVAGIRDKIIASMLLLEEQSFNLDAMGESSKGMSLSRVNSENREAGTTSSATTISERDEDPSFAAFEEDWATKKERIRRTSPYGMLTNWDLVSVIVKTGTDFRQEAFACQLIGVCAKIWKEAQVDVWVRSMKILVTGENSGLVETVIDGVSLHSIKRTMTLQSIAMGQNPRKRVVMLKSHFDRVFGPESSQRYAAAIDAFVRSLAGYSILSHVLQLKDRHNGNILLDSAGHTIHIDFGYMFANSPGNMSFEAAPFKLTNEFVEVIGGIDSEPFHLFTSLCREAFLALRKHAEPLLTLVEIMSRSSLLPCFAGVSTAQTIAALRSRLAMHLSVQQASSFVDDLLAKSLGSYYTRMYDTYQYRTQGIY